jgi:lysophospholipase L1-like esterase
MIERHPTGTTILIFLVTILVMSLLPLPAELRPLDVRGEEQPLYAIAKLVFRRAESVPRKGDAAAADFAIREDEPALEEDDTPKPELEVAPRPADAEVAKPKRAAWKRPARPKLDAFRQKLSFEPVAIEESCADPISAGRAGCKRRALDRFMGRLADGDVARVVHYGDSIIASDHITDVVRLRLQERFGSAGKGFLLVARYNQRQRRLRTGDGEGWRAEHIAQGKLPDLHFGYAGSAFTAERAGASSVFEVGASRFVDVYYLAQPSGGAIELLADDRPVHTIDAAAPEPKVSFAEVELPAGTKTLRLVAKKADLRVFGVALEANVPGVIYESIGVPGTTSEVWLFPEPEGFRAQLAHRDPALVVTMLGGNDARTIHQKRRKIEDVEKGTRGFIQALKRGAPNADCLIVSPLDGVHAKASGEMTSKPEVKKVIEVQRKVAREEGCAFWDMFASMGGAGSLEKWFNAGLINPDLIHPRATGGDLLGEMMAEALMNAYDERHAERAELQEN